MTLSQRIAKQTNEINRCAKIAGLSYSKFSLVQKKVLAQWPHMTMQDVAEEIDGLYNDLDLANPADNTAIEIASFVNDLWEVVYS